jgi:hypothetical protein
MPSDKVITEEDRRMRLPLWGYIVIPVGAFLLFALFDHFGKLALARSTSFSVSIIIITIAMRWKLRGHLWFWVTMAILAAPHVPLVLFIPWTTKWIPVLVIIPVGIADSYAMLWVLSVVGRFMRVPMATNGKRPRSQKMRQDQDA